MIEKLTLQPTRMNEPTAANTEKTVGGVQEKFGTALKDAINKVNEAQLESDKATNMLVSGKNIDLHTVMIASQKASITLQTTMEIRNKAIEAYQEIMRMQI